MTNSSINTRKFFTIALVLHVLVLLCFFLKLLAKPVQVEMPMRVLPVFISEAGEKPSLEKTTSAKDGIQKKSLLITSRHVAFKHAIEQPLSIKITNDPLLKLLHEAIAANQHYPETAMRLSQEGTVTVGMKIFPDGHIENISMLHSSGASILDIAAINAVHEIAAIKDANLYIKSPQYFLVDVIFQL
jgi:TonB family protein